MHGDTRIQGPFHSKTSSINTVPTPVPMQPLVFSPCRRDRRPPWVPTLNEASKIQRHVDQVIWNRDTPPCHNDGDHLLHQVRQHTRRQEERQDICKDSMCVSWWKEGQIQDTHHNGQKTGQLSRWLWNTYSKSINSETAPQQHNIHSQCKIHDPQP